MYSAAMVARSQRIHGAVALALTLLFLAWIRLGWGGTLATRAFVDISTTLVAAFAAGLAWRHARSSGHRASWGLMAAGCLAWALGNMAWTWYELSGQAVPFPSWADAGYLAFLPCMALALVLLVDGGAAVASRARTVLDGLLIASAMLFIAYVVFLKSIGQYATQQEGVLAKALAVAYPLGDVVLLSLVLLVASRLPRDRQQGLAWTGVGLLALAAGDVGFWLRTAEGTYATGAYTDAGWLVAFLALGQAALLPASQAPDAPQQAPGPLLSVLPIMPFAVGTTVAIAVYAREGNLEPFLFWTAIVVIATLALRQLLMVVENVRLRQDVEKSLAQLQAQEGLRNRLLDNILHDLRSPLSPILLQLRLLKTPGLPEAARSRGIDIVDRNVQQVQRLVQDLSDVSLLQDGNLTLVPAPFDAGELVEEVAATFRPAAAAVQVTLACDARPCRAYGDPDRVRQVLVNLVRNAINFTPPGGQVAIAVEATPAGCLFEVRDTGRGLTREESARLFQPFSQVHERSEGRERGTGLGLYICQGLVTRHGGKVWVESEGRGKGSAFRFTIPNPAPALPSPPVAAAPAPAQTPTARP